jgi:hypothetical protein
MRACARGDARGPTTTVFVRCVRRKRVHTACAARDAEPAALADGEAPVALVRPDLPTALVHERPGARLEAVALEEGAVVVAGEEARILALGAGGDGEPGRRGFGARLLLRPAAEREREPAEEARVEPGEHVALVLRGVGGPREEQPAAALDDPGVVPGREPRGTAPGGRAESSAS